jgi:beta-N-acetylhexosaminidase
MPRPADLTPADTSSYVQPGLAAALRHYHPRLEQFQTAQEPSPAQIAALKEEVSQYDLLILVTLSASMHSPQAEMARQLLDLQLPTVTVAARTPYDITSYPQARTHLCTYSIQPPSMQALAAALWGQAPISGRLPVRLPGGLTADRGPLTADT